MHHPKNIKTVRLTKISPYMHPLADMFMHPQGKCTTLKFALASPLRLTQHFTFPFAVQWPCGTFPGWQGEEGYRETVEVSNNSCLSSCMIRGEKENRRLLTMVLLSAPSLQRRVLYLRRRYSFLDFVDLCTLTISFRESCGGILLLCYCIPPPTNKGVKILSVKCFGIDSFCHLNWGRRPSP